MTSAVTPFAPGQVPTEPGWYLAENDSLTRYVVQVIPCRGGLFVFETERTETFPVDTYDAYFLARLDLEGLAPRMA